MEADTKTTDQDLSLAREAVNSKNTNNDDLDFDSEPASVATDQETEANKEQEKLLENGGSRLNHKRT